MTDPIEEPSPIRLPFYFSAWPTLHIHVTQPFAARPEVYSRWNLPGHEGVDLRARLSEPIFAVATGKVYQVRNYQDGHNYGTRVRIRHRQGYRTIYAHLSSTLVREGQIVYAGQPIGRAGSTGNSSAAHLHLTLKNDRAARGRELYIGYPYEIIDPSPYLHWLQVGAGLVDSEDVDDFDHVFTGGG